MTVKAKFQCNGCFAEVEGGLIERTFVPLTSGLGGFGTYQTTTIEESVPKGWVAFDPYTQATYCPDCWAEIEDYIEEKEAHQ